MTDRHMRVELSNAFCLVSAMTARAYYETSKTSVPIMEPYEHYLLLYNQLKNRAAEFSHPRLYAVLRTLFGESTTLYDDYKSSFGYPFRLQIFRTDQIVDYLLNFTDYKGGTRFYFHKVLSALRDPSHTRGIQSLRDPVDDEFSQDDMSHFMTAFMLYLADDSDTLVDENQEAFCRSLDYCHIIYGLRNRQFFLDRYPDDNAYNDAKTAILRRGDMPFNEVKANR